MRRRSRDMKVSQKKLGAFLILDIMALWLLLWFWWGFNTVIGAWK